MSVLNLFSFNVILLSEGFKNFLFLGKYYFLKLIYGILCVIVINRFLFKCKVYVFFCVFIR